MIEPALRYLRAGLCVLPAVRAEKRPAVPRWKEFQRALPSEEQLAAWCRRADALCLVCGTVSGNLEMLDFDLGGEAFDAWYAKVRESDATLPDRLAVEQSPSGGWHVVYRCQEPVCGNLQLAQRIASCGGPEKVTIAGKTYKPRQDAQGRWHVVLTMIETRGEGGLFLCAPTPGYEVVQGDLAELPVLSAAERETLLEVAWSLNQYWPPAALVRPSNGPVANPGIDARPGDDFNQRGDVRTLLRRHGWTLAKPASSAGNEHWRRPGKTSGTSATLKDGVFYCFTTSAAPFEPNRAYSPFAVYALLEHGGDYAAAAAALRAQGFGGDSSLRPADRRASLPQTVDLSGIIGPSDPPPPAEPATPDPGPMPEDLLDVPRHPEKAQPTHRKLRAKDRPLANDLVSEEEFNRLLHAWLGQLARVLLPGHAAYIWGGYATTPLNPEPFAYESSLVVRWLIQEQAQGSPALNCDPAKGEVKSPLLLWGPYLWADGIKGRKSDGLVWHREDFAADGTHPSDSGRQKVARLLLDFFKTDPLAKRWFVEQAGP